MVAHEIDPDRFFTCLTKVGRRMRQFSVDTSTITNWIIAAALSLCACDIAHAEIASIYGGRDGLCAHRTANGEHLNCATMTAAHRTLPFGTLVKSRRRIAFPQG